MRALVTGAGGFVGSHLLDALIARGCDVIGTSWRPMTGGVTAHLTSDRLAFGDITDGAFLREVLQSHRFDVVFHLAGRDASFGNPELYGSNVVGTAALLDAVGDLGQKNLKVVLLGSSAQYGALSDDPVREESPFRPISNYGISKMACEAMGRLMFEQTGQAVMCARGFNVIGPGQKAKLLQGTIIEQIVAIEAGKRPAVIELGDLSAYRDFIDVRDVAAGLIAVASHGEAGEAYNLCSGHATQVSEFVSRLVRLARTGIAVHSHRRDGIANLPYQVGSNDKLRAKANWVPEIMLEKSLSDALDEGRRGAAPLGAMAAEVANVAGER